MKTGISIVLLFLMTSGCEDFIVKDIQHKEVILLAPADGIRTVFTDQTFVWEPVEEATAYRLVISSPGFQKVERWIMDTIITVDRFSVVLTPGEYEWGVRAENSEYATAYTYRRLIVYEPENRKEEGDEE